ncbi:hypothetical protein ACGVWS_13765, partial [Enterobacteriaceae bacterium LUAb1]
MQSLSEKKIMEIYANAVITLYENPRLSVSQQQKMIDDAIKKIFITCQIPVPQVIWHGGNDSEFSEKDWSLLLSTPIHFQIQEYRADHNSRIRMLTTGYHEARHCEQFWLMLLGVMSHQVKPPSQLYGQFTLPAFATHDAKMKQLEHMFSVPPYILHQARLNYSGFPAARINEVETWINSYYGDF